MEKILFKEEQKFTQWWLWLLLGVGTLVSVGPVAAGIYSQEVLHKPYGNDPTETSEYVIILIVVSIIWAVILAVFKMAVLKTEVRSDGIWFSFPPFIRRWRCISKEEIEKYELRIYNAKHEFGGYGVKSGGRQYGKAFNISGNIGLQLFLKNSKKVLIGTQKKQAMEYALRKMMEQDNERL